MIFEEFEATHPMALRQKPLEYEITSNGCWNVINRTLDKDGYGKIIRNELWKHVGSTGK